MKNLSIEKNTAIASILIITISILAYLPVWSNSFVTFDTQGYVIDNAKIRSFDFIWMLTSFDMANWHPLTWLSYTIDYSIYGLNPTGYLATNLALHIFNCLLLLHVARKIFQYLDFHSPVIAATIATAIFAVHPQHVEAVAWIAQRKELLCTFFMLLSIATYLRYAERSSENGKLWLTLSVCTAALALMAKPMAVTLPVILLILDVYPLGRTPWFSGKVADRTVPLKLIIEKIPFIILSGAVSLLTILAQGEGGAIASVEKLGFGYRLLNAADTFFLYLSKWLLPINLSPFYEYENYQAIEFSFLHLLPVIAFVGVFFLAGYLWTRNQKHWLIVLVYYSVTLLPVIGLVQVGTQAAADRYTYITLIPFYLLAAVGIIKLINLLQLNNTLIPASLMSLLVVSPLSYLTYQQCKIWKNDLVFWQYTTLQSPKSGLVRHNYGVALYHAGEFEKAVNEFKIGLQIRQSTLTQQWLGNAYYQQGKLEKAKRSLMLSMKPGIDSRYVRKVEVYNQLAKIFLLQNDIGTARKLVMAAIQIDKNNQEAQDILKAIKGASN